MLDFPVVGLWCRMLSSVVPRLYSEWYRLGKRAGGNHTVRVSLSSNDHRDLTYDGNVIADKINVQVD